MDDSVSTRSCTAHCNNITTQSDDVQACSEEDDDVHQPVRFHRLASLLILVISATGFLLKRSPNNLVERMSVSSSVLHVSKNDHISSTRTRPNQTKSSSLQRRKRNMNITMPNKENGGKKTLLNQNKTENNQQLSIVVQLSGELGNHISKLATAIAIAIKWNERLKHSSEEEEPLLPVADLLLRHQNHPKWVTAAANFRKCFPNVAALNFSAANTDEFQIRVNQQNQYLVASRTYGGSHSLTELLEGINSNSADHVDHTLSWLSDNISNLSSWGKEHAATAVESNGLISFPFLYSNYFTAQDFWMDEYYSAFRRYFEWDYDRPDCCASLPEQDEHIFHFRNFLQEMPRKAILKGYEELSPERVAHDLFGHLPPNTKVAILTRFPESIQAQAYVDALRARGLSVRLLANQTAVQDFCFLLSARQEIVGLARSTFFYWAGILGHAPRVRAYSVDSPSKRQSGTPVFDHYNWTHPELKRRVFFELYQAR